MGALHGAGGALQDLLAGGDVTGERHHAHQRVLHQRCPHALAPAADDVDDAAREELAGELRQAQGGERGLLGGLSTTVLPAASTGAIFQAAIISG